MPTLFDKQWMPVWDADEITQDSSATGIPGAKVENALYNLDQALVLTQYKTAVDSNDTTTGFLASKIEQGTNISITVTSDTSGSEKLNIAATGGTATTYTNAIALGSDTSGAFKYDSNFTYDSNALYVPIDIYVTDYTKGIALLDSAGSYHRLRVLTDGNLTTELLGS